MGGPHTTGYWDILEKDQRLEKLERENRHGLTFIRGQSNLSTLMGESHLAVRAPDASLIA